MAKALTHEDCVDTWLEQSAAQTLSREDALDLFEGALRVLWAHTSTTLGEVTLTAIADRVLHNASEHFPAFGSLRVEANGRIQSRELRGSIDLLHHVKLLEGMRFVLVEFLTVLGNLTAELMTPELHAELCNGASRPAGREASRGPNRSPKTEPKDRS